MAIIKSMLSEKYRSPDTRQICVHLIHSGFITPIFCNYSPYLFAKRFDILRIGEETIQYLREGLYP